jgi:hypothetical protein
MAGLEATLPPGGDVREAYRLWYERRNREHTEMLERMAERFNRIQVENGRSSRTQDT